jgi:hypothetical protein
MNLARITGFDTLVRLALALNDAFPLKDIEVFETGMGVARSTSVRREPKVRLEQAPRAGAWNRLDKAPIASAQDFLEGRLRGDQPRITRRPD